jgi:hypothetical protein
VGGAVLRERDEAGPGVHRGQFSGRVGLVDSRWPLR